MLELKALGVAFAVDDFGTGYSSLSYLKRFPIDILKVDKSFVDDVGDSDKALALAEAIVQLGKSLNLDTVAEGIEKSSQVDGLRALGCRLRAGLPFRPAASARGHGRLLPLMASGELLDRPERAGGQATGMTSIAGPGRPARRLAHPSERPRLDSRWADLERLASSHPMMDAVIDEVQGPAHPRRRPLAVRLRLLQLPRLRPPPGDHRRRWSGAVGSGARTRAGPACSGSPRPYVEIEEQLTELLGAPDTLVLPTITLIHTSVIPVLAGQGAVLVDAQAHKTHLRGRHDRPGRRRHPPPGQGQRPRAPGGGPALAAPEMSRMFCIDGVNSMTGNAPDLPRVRPHLPGVRRPVVRRRRPRFRGHRRVAHAGDALRAPGQQHRPVFRRELRQHRPGGRVLQVLLVPGGVPGPADLAKEPPEGGRPALSVLRARRPPRRWPPCWPGFKVNDAEGDDIRRSLAPKTSRVLDQIAQLGLRTLNTSGLPSHRAPPRPRRRHRRGGEVPLRPGHLRDAGRLPAGAEVSGRLPRPGDGGQRRRRDRPAQRGPGRARRAFRHAAAHRHPADQAGRPRVAHGAAAPAGLPAAVDRHGRLASGRRHFSSSPWPGRPTPSPTSRRPLPMSAWPRPLPRSPSCSVGRRRLRPLLAAGPSCSGPTSPGGGRGRSWPPSWPAGPPTFRSSAWPEP